MDIVDFNYLIIYHQYSKNIKNSWKIDLYQLTRKHQYKYINSMS